MINSEFLKSLNDAQKSAVTHLDGPLLIVAGAGSGKTKVITSRIANLIKEKMGTVIVFPSYMVHRVRPVTKGTRYSLVSWFCGEPFV